ncbi:MAG TPA: amidase family protein, partial [Burkholderiales bacterium]|nr:amidase family protein [Burkholderiales bacterium]
MNDSNGCTRRTFLARASALTVAPFGWGLPTSPVSAQGSLTDLTAVQAVSAMRAGDMKAEDYAKVLLARCESLRHLNAFITLDAQKVLSAARNADRTRARGASLGVLHGLPVPIKDSINTKDLPTTAGTPALRNFRPRADAPVAKALFDAGAIALGKTNLHELSFGWTSINTNFGAVRNPYDQAYIPGGSSGGTAVAVAARMAPAGLAEDTCGSVRVPAALSGIAGFRPSSTRWPVEGVAPLTTVFDTLGPHARSVGDLALFDAVVTGNTTPPARGSLRGVRLGVIRDFFYATLDPEVERVAGSALQRLRDAGAELVEGSIPELEKLWATATFPIIQHETRPSITDYLAKYDTGVSWDALLEQASDDLKHDFGLFVLDDATYRAPREAYEEARTIHRPALQNAFRRYFGESAVSAIVYPATMVPALPIDGEALKTGEVDIQGNKVPFFVAISRNIAPASTAGIPGLVLPAGLTRQGLPVGIEFDAPEMRDGDLLALGFALER